MKKVIFTIIISLLCFVIFAQSYKDIAGAHPIDSCLIIAKGFPGWRIADTADIRALAPKLKGFAYLTSTKYEGDNYIEVELRNPLRKLLATGWNINNVAFYNLVLVPDDKQ